MLNFLVKNGMIKKQIIGVIKIVNVELAIVIPGLIQKKIIKG